MRVIVQQTVTLWVIPLQAVPLRVIPLQAIPLRVILLGMVQLHPAWASQILQAFPAHFAELVRHLQWADYRKEFRQLAKARGKHRTSMPRP